jgi:hypothetical protein
LNKNDKFIPYLPIKTERNQSGSFLGKSRDIAKFENIAVDNPQRN